ncbi:MAG TPA: HEAT repeat domain-containing protein [Polyangiales bacterium]|nr:HEAT repeat domain-containing protein [Polyangiales bacterium]
MDARRTRARGWRIVLVSALLLACAQWSARAEDDVVLVRMLHEGQSANVRAGAASLIARRRDVERRPDLEGALHDDQPVVRAAAASGLGRLGSRESIDPLHRVATHDRVSTVAREARAAIESIQRQPGNEVYVERSKPRYGLMLGEMRNESSFRAPELTLLLGRSIEQNLVRLPTAALIHSTPDEVNGAAERGLSMFRLDGAVMSLVTVERDGQLSMHCEVSLLVLDQPTGALRTLLKGAARGVEISAGERAAQELSIAHRVVDAAVRSALRNADQAIADAARPVSLHR